MFYDFAHFKKATQLLFKETCSNGMTLCQYRDRMAQMIGFSNQQSLKENFEKNDPKVHVVSVIVLSYGKIQAKHDFKDNDAGNKEAEDLFQRITETHKTCKELVKQCMPSYDEKRDDSNIQVFIAHSCSAQ